MLAVVAVVATPAVAQEQIRSGPTIRYTEYGIPHIIASDFFGLGKGYGYASASDNICILADIYLTVDAQRSRFLGPDGVASAGYLKHTSNLNSDFFYQRIKDDHTVERLVDQPAPYGPDPEVKEIVRGYVDGYNRYLTETGVNKISDPACRGAAWVRPIDTMDVYRHVLSSAVMGSAEPVLDGEVNAAPPPSVLPTGVSAEVARKISDEMAAAHEHGIGSDALAAGSEGVASGTGVLLGNPHFPWQGRNRMWQSQLTIPGKLDVAGASLLGLPAVLIGYNSDVAWSHTVATVSSFGLFELQIDPLHPTRYLVDGRWTDMTAQSITVQVRNPDGSIAPVTRTLWSSRYGPITTALSGIPLPWGLRAYAVRDANMDNIRGLNTWLRLDRAHSVTDVVHDLESTQGVPFANTVAVDRTGKALYADIQAAPNITDQHARDCLTPIGRVTFDELHRPGTPPIAILDGTRSACDWPNAPGTVGPGLLDPTTQPRLIRSDFVSNANDSPWLANPAQPLSYPRVMGDADGSRSPRTRELALAAQHRIEGTDSVPGRGFSADTMKQLLFAEHSYVADLAVDDVVRMCRSFIAGLAPYSGGMIDVSAACPVLASWDRTFRLDSPGAVLFATFWDKLPIPNLGLDRFGTEPWKVPFDPGDPLHTPNTFDTGRPDVWLAFGNAVDTMRKNGIRLDAPLSAVQTVTRGDDRIPIPGGPGELGVLNVIATDNDEHGNPDVTFGSSFIEVVHFTGDGPPLVSTLMTYSQSSDPTSPHYADQTELFSAGRWLTDRFTEEQIAASPSLTIKTLD
ncbi:penicillin acylase family protein [Nocardia terpenica]|uniref:penicillin acylase family protein n=1 Tax=Nocardia terpenica TaxID=455432 RepID=UPI0019327972|nr:penicillin acylase family protein [Nocardia terpenica]